jgi:sigma54-dependent transcription regulator
MEEVSLNAFYDSDNRPDPPKCHPNTRVTVINKITEWAIGMIDIDAFMLWLYGPTGAGKTAIARKVAELINALRSEDSSSLVSSSSIQIPNAIQ